MQEYFKILGLTPDATDEQIEEAYQTLKNRYSFDRFLEGEKGNEAARNLTKLETAYHEIKASRAAKINGEQSFSEEFSDVESLIKKGNIALAQAKLDDIINRNAEWHYLQSVIFYKKNWINECKKQLEIALNMEPHNVKYSDSYTKLKQKIEYNDKQFQAGNAGAGQQSANRQMGGTDTNGCMDFCLTWCCMNMLCNMCCNCR